MPRQTSVNIPCGGLELEGVLHLPDTGAPFPAVIVCHPHPQYGGDMRNNVVAAAVEGLTAHGLAALRFNFRGAGRSGGEQTGGDAEPGDVRAALRYAAAATAVDAARVGLAGYSFGAMMALAAAGPPVAALALISPPLAWGAPAPATFEGPLLLLAGDRDQFCPEDELRALAGARPNVELSVVAGASHFWAGHESDVARHVGEFFARSLGTPR